MAATPEEIAALEILQTAQKEYRQALVNYAANIKSAKENIASAQEQIALDRVLLTDPDLLENPEVLEKNILDNERSIAENTNIILINQSTITTTNTLLAEAVEEEQSISEAINGPGPTAPPVPVSADNDTSPAATTEPQNVQVQEQPTSTAAQSEQPNSQTAVVEDPYEAVRLAALENDKEPPTESAVDVDEEDPEVANMREQAQEINRAQLAQEATDVEPGPGIGQIARDAGPSFGENPDAEDEAASAAQAGRINAQRQQTLQARQNRNSQGDWRVRIHLAPGSNYLYNAPGGTVGGQKLAGPGILAPLTDTDGVIFPYTPVIETSYQAKYQTSELVHSNYRGYFYQGSYIDNITVRGTFTAQDTREAQYLLATIHFFRSVTKMFYGKDQQAGTPPPLVYLSGLGQYQFNKHPCVVSNFQYSLPNDVDYIRADGFNNYGINLENRRSLSSGPSIGGALTSLANKLGVNGLFPGGLKQVPGQGAVTASVSNTTNKDSTYVPTKMEISVTLLPIQTRSQVSQQFSLQAFANGNLLKGGFW